MTGRGSIRLPVLVVLAAGSLVAAGLKATGRLGAPRATPRELARELLGAHAAALAPGEAAAPTESAETPLFTDVAPALGIDFVHDNAAHGDYYIPEEMGPGAGFLDYDGDGDLDLFVGGGGAFDGEGAVQRCRLYRNDGERFTDVSEATGADIPGHVFGVACADYDDDGDVDIFATRIGPNALLRNEGGRFTEIGEAVGVADPGFGTSATFFDYDGDGRLDLYVANYVRWSRQHESPCYTVLGVRDYCNPVLYAATTDRLYRNRGDGTFEDASDRAGISAQTGNGLGVVASDFDGDGHLDLYVANDQTPAILWHNNGDGTFTNESAQRGCAYDARGVAIAGMGVACEDLDADGDFDLLVTNIHDQTHLVLANERGTFSDVSLRMGVGGWSLPATTFGVAIFDQDHDGVFDAFFANGEVNIDNRLPVSDNPYAQADHFVRFRDGRMIDATAESGAAFSDVGRGVASADYDNDGDLDLLVTNNGGPLRLLRNDNASGHAWLMVEPRTAPTGAPGLAGRAAIGARVEIEAGGRTQVREIRPQQSYLTSGDFRAHFGLGAARRVDRVVVTWPDGSRSTLTAVDADQVIVVTPEDGRAGEAP